MRKKNAQKVRENVAVDKKKSRAKYLSKLNMKENQLTSLPIGKDYAGFFHFFPRSKSLFIF